MKKTIMLTTGIGIVIFSVAYFLLLSNSADVFYAAYVFGLVSFLANGLCFSLTFDDVNKPSSFSYSTLSIGYFVIYAVSTWILFDSNLRTYIAAQIIIVGIFAILEIFMHKSKGYIDNEEEESNEIFHSYKKIVNHVKVLQSENKDNALLKKVSDELEYLDPTISDKDYELLYQMAFALDNNMNESYLKDFITAIDKIKLKKIG